MMRELKMELLNNVSGGEEEPPFSDDIITLTGSKKGINPSEWLDVGMSFLDYASQGWVEINYDGPHDGGDGDNDTSDASTEPNSEGEFEQTENAGEFKYNSEKEAAAAAKAALGKLVAANPGIEIRIDVYKNSNGDYGFTNAYTDFSSSKVDGRPSTSVGLFGASDFQGSLHNHPGHDISDFDLSHSQFDNQLAASGVNVYILDSQGELYQLISVGGGQYIYRQVSS